MSPGEIITYKGVRPEFIESGRIEKRVGYYGGLVGGAVGMSGIVNGGTGGTGGVYSPFTDSYYGPNGRQTTGTVSSSYIQQQLGQQNQYNQLNQQQGLQSSLAQKVQLQYAVNGNKKKELRFMGLIREYFQKHRDLFMTIAVLVVLDRYLLGGAFQERLKRIVTGILDKTEDTLKHHEPLSIAKK